MTTQPAADTRDFTFSFRSESGAIAPPLFAYLQVLSVQGASGRVMMLLNRQGGDLSHPVGLFGVTLAPDRLAAVTAAVESIKWNELPEPTGGDISAATLSIAYTRDKRTIQRSFSARSREFMHAVAPVMTQVEEIGEALEQHPLRALKVEVVRIPRGFKLVIRNIGTGPVMLADARTPGKKPGTTRGTITIARTELGTEPTSFNRPAFEPLPLQPLGQAPPHVVLAPGQAHEVETVPWTPARPGHYFAGGTWEDYAGPVVDPKAVMPMIPDPDHLNDPRPYVLRGAAFSNDINFTIEKPQR
jgi:hypothetical protein